jgi:hypothetical protein
MSNLRYGILGMGILGVISVFLPFVSEKIVSFSLWDTVGSQGRTLLQHHPYTHVAMSLVAVAMGGIGLLRPPARWQAVVAGIAFFVAAVNMRGYFFKLEALTSDHAIGAKLMWVSVACGLVLSILAAARSDESE